MFILAPLAVLKKGKKCSTVKFWYEDHLILGLIFYNNLFSVTDISILLYVCLAVKTSFS